MLPINEPPYNGAQGLLPTVHKPSPTAVDPEALIDHLAERFAKAFYEMFAPRLIADIIEGIGDEVTEQLCEELPAVIAAEGDRLAYDLDQLADATTLSKRTLESHVADGTLSTVRVGRRLLILRESAQAFLRSFHLRKR